RRLLRRASPEHQPADLLGIQDDGRRPGARGRGAGPGEEGRMSERLQDLIEEVDRAHSNAASVEALARSARDALSRRIKGHAFRMDWVAKVLDSVAAADKAPSPAARNGGSPMHRNARLCYQFRVFFWAPGFVSAPHQHNTWGVTGVLHNRSSVVLYRRQDES